MNKIIKKLLLEKGFLTGKYCLPPESLSLIITFRCNFRCQSCSIWQKTDHNELADENWLKIIPNLNILNPLTFVELNGGEPLIRKELVLKLIKELKKKFKNVALNSNGLLINEKTVFELADAGLDIVKISFYSLEKDIHNFLRGNPEAYDRALNAMELLSKSKIKLEVGLLITAKNIQSLPDLIKYLKKYKNASIILQPLDESVESPDSKDLATNNLLTDLWPKKEEIIDFFNWVVNNHEQIKNSLDNLEAIKKYYLNPPSVLNYRCFAGQRNLVIYPNSDVALCFKGKPIGNLNERSLERTLKGEKALIERKKIKKCQKYCRIIGCNFSKGLTEFMKSKLQK